MSVAIRESTIGTKTLSVSRLNLGAVPSLASLIYTAILWPTLHQALLERHPFRQTQTAFVARIFAAKGIDLLHPVVPVFGTGSQVPYEMPWYEAVASLPIRLGLGEEFSLRFTALVFTIVTAHFLARIVANLMDRPSGALASVIYLFSPFTLLWGRTSLIETFTTAVVLGWIYLLTRKQTYTPGRDWIWLVGASAIGSIAWTSKITTAIPWSFLLIPTTLGFIRTRDWRRLAQIFIASAVPAFAGFAWTFHADRIKGANPLTAWLTSGRVFSFTFGTVHQRLDLRNWAAIGARVQDLLLGRYGTQALIIAGVWWIWKSRGGVVALTLMAVPLSAVGIFFNLYVVHDYYLAAIAPALAAFQAIGIVGLCRLRLNQGDGSKWTKTLSDPDRLPGAWLASVAVITVVLSGATSYWLLPFQVISRHPAGTEELFNWTAKNDLIIVNGMDWDPHLLFYAHRTGVMLPVPHVSVSDLRRSDQFRSMSALFSVRFDDQIQGVLRGASWIAPVTAHLYRFAPTSSVAQPDRSFPVLFRPSIDPIKVESGSRSVRVSCHSMKGGQQPATVHTNLAPIGNLLYVHNEGAISFAMQGLARIPAQDGRLSLAASAPTDVSCNGPDGSSIEILRVSDS